MLCWMLEIFKIAVEAYLLIYGIKETKESNDSVVFQFVVIIDGIFLFMTLIPFLCLSYLCILHIYLYCTRKSTLDLIMESRKNNRVHPAIKKISEQLNKDPDPEDSSETPNPFLVKNIEKKQNLKALNSSEPNIPLYRIILPPVQHHRGLDGNIGLENK